MDALCIASAWALEGFRVNEPKVRENFVKGVSTHPELLTLVEHTADKIAIWYDAGCPKTAPENLVSSFEKQEPLRRSAIEYMLNSIATTPPLLHNYAKRICTVGREVRGPRAFMLTGLPAQPMVYLGDAIYVLSHPRVNEPMLKKALVWLYF